MSELPDDRDHVWTERIVKVAGIFGFNETRLRWKLLRWSERRDSGTRTAGDALAHARYEHAVCTECGRVQPRGTRECLGCGAPMLSHALQVLRRIGFISPIQVSVGTFLAGLIALCYVRQVAFAGAWWSFGTDTLLPLGAHWPPLELHGQWWRLGTAMFLHGGLLHVGFNLMALTQICPEIETQFGRGRTLFLYVATGLVAFLPSVLLRSGAVSVGASGAIMGLIGVAAGWGHRDGTTIGLQIRNNMVRWLAYTTVIGFLVHADHLAHFSGFAAGGVLGLTTKPQHLGGRSPAADLVLGLLAAAVALACVALVVIAPARDLAF